MLAYGAEQLLGISCDKNVKCYCPVFAPSLSPTLMPLAWKKNYYTLFPLSYIYIRHVLPFNSHACIKPCSTQSRAGINSETERRRGILSWDMMSIWREWKKRSDITSFGGPCVYVKKIVCFTEVS